LERSEEEASTALPGGFTPPSAVTRSKRPWRLKEGLQVLGSRLYALVKLAILVALILMVVRAFQAPESWPSLAEKDAERAGRFTETMETASTSPGAVTFKWTADDVAMWFASVIEFKQPENTYSLRPRGAYALPGDGVLRVGLEAELPVGSLPVFMKAEYKPVRRMDGYTLEPVQYSIGRLIIPPYLGWPVQVHFSGMAEALSRPLSYFSKASAIEITPDAVVVRWPGKKR